MKQMIRLGFIAACLVTGVLLIAGCGGDDDKGTGLTGLSAQDQYDQLSTVVEFDPDAPEGVSLNVTDLMLNQTMTQFWDGIDENDFNDPGLFLSSGLAASVSIDADTSLSYSYDPVSGWWYIEFSITTFDQSSGTSISLALKDSVRYETEAGTPQMIPDETTTNRVLQKATISLGAGIVFSGTSIQFDVDAASDVDAAGLNTSVVNITGDGVYALGIGVTSDQGTVDMNIGMETSWDDVSINDPMSDNSCPTAGGISGNFTLDLDVQDNTGHYQANGDWDVGILFTGGGNTTVNVQSGDFQKSFTGNVCTK